MKKAIIYCRSATTDQQSINKLASQKEDCLAYAEAHNYEVVEIITEAGFSGMDSSRQGIQKLIGLCDENKIKAMIISDADRLSRDRNHLEGLMQVFINQHIELILLERPSNHSMFLHNSLRSNAG
ncbi:MAG: recombinase family protein [Anaerolineales bacterium]|nr:recombinase family protein [Anaerolineales bacterium]